MNLELLSNSDKIDLDECNPECLPFDKSLDNAIKNAKGKTPEELKKQFEGEDEELRERADEYVRNTKNYYDDNNDNDDSGYSSEEDIPTCNPWRE